MISASNSLPVIQLRNLGKFLKHKINYSKRLNYSEPEDNTINYMDIIALEKKTKMKKGSGRNHIQSYFWSFHVEVSSLGITLYKLLTSPNRCL